MVGRVDRALRENFGIADGLADPRVVVLDPCCGTGAYLVETLRLIHAAARGERRRNAGRARRSGKPRRTASSASSSCPRPTSSPISRSISCSRAGAPCATRSSESKGAERAGVFLTNALTGWVPPEEPKTLPFPEFTAERDAADHVKREARSSSSSATRPTTASPASRSRKSARSAKPTARRKPRPKPQGQGLNDLYVRFFRMAERRIAEGAPAATIRARPAPRRRAGHRLLHLELLVARRPLAPRHARALPRSLRLHHDRLPQRRQIQDRQENARRQARPERLLDREESRRHPGRHRHRADGALAREAGRRRRRIRRNTRRAPNWVRNCASGKGNTSAHLRRLRLEKPKADANVSMPSSEASACRFVPIATQSGLCKVAKLAGLFCQNHFPA